MTFEEAKLKLEKDFYPGEGFYLSKKVWVFCCCFFCGGGGGEGVKVSNMMCSFLSYSLPLPSSLFLTLSFIYYNFLHPLIII